MMRVIRKNRNASSDAEGIDAFVNETGTLCFRKISAKMRLIGENDWRMSVFLARTIVLSDGEMVDGQDLWNRYKELLMYPPNDYAQFRVQLSEISSKLNLFIYQIKKNSNIAYSDRVGEIYCIENGEEYFSDGRLDKRKLEKEGGLFIEI